MRERPQMRLDILEKQWEAGQADLEKVKKKQAYLPEPVLRTSGAPEVLEELLAEDQLSRQEGSSPSETRTTLPLKRGR